MKKLSERAMLASLHIDRWLATRTDKAITNEIAQRHGVNAKRAGNYRKHVINTEAESYCAVATAAGRIRDEHYRLTLPWAQNGARILTAVAFEQYSAAMRKLRAEFNVAVDKFLADYPNLVDAARAELNGMWDAKDYPSDIRSKFGMDVKIFPLPDQQDFRADLPAEAVDSIRVEIAAELERTAAEAMRDPYQRLFERVSAMAERLKDPEGTIKQPMLDGLLEICAILPGLNLTGDPQLTALTTRAQEMVLGISAQNLRDSDALRTSVADKAQQITDVMAAFMGAQS